MTIGERIKKIRLEKGMTQKEIAESIGIATNSFSRYEIGEREPKLEMIEKIASALKVSVYELIGGFGAFDDVLPPNMQGANLDGAKIDINFLEYMISRLSYIVDNDSYLNTKYNILKIAESSGLINQAQISINAIEKYRNATPKDIDKLCESSGKLFKSFYKLNSLGQQKAIERVEELIEVPKYTKPDNED